MSEDRERDLQDWFNRSTQDLPRQPFTLQVVEKVRGRERSRQWQRYAALLAVILGACLLIPELTGLFGSLVTMTGALSAVVGEFWPLLILLPGGLVYWLVRRVRGRGPLG
jgi:hypothetical protein